MTAHVCELTPVLSLHLYLPCFLDFSVLDTPCTWTHLRPLILPLPLTGCSWGVPILQHQFFLLFVVCNRRFWGSYATYMGQCGTSLLPSLNHKGQVHSGREILQETLNKGFWLSSVGLYPTPLLRLLLRVPKSHSLAIPSQSVTREHFVLFLLHLMRHCDRLMKPWSLVSHTDAGPSLV